MQQILHIIQVNTEFVKPFFAYFFTSLGGVAKILRFCGIPPYIKEIFRQNDYFPLCMRKNHGKYLLFETGCGIMKGTGSVSAGCIQPTAAFCGHSAGILRAYRPSP